MKNGKKTVSVTADDLNLEVIYDELAYNKIMHWCNKAVPAEVSGLGNVIYDKATGVLRVTDVWLLEQENGAATTDIDDEAVGKLMYKHHSLTRSGEIEGDLKLWWHSHVNMGVFWSGTDMNTIKQLGDGGWFLSSVFNVKEEVKTCISMTDPMKLFIDDIPTNIEADEIVNDEAVLETLEGMGYSVKDIDAICTNLTLEIDADLKAEWDKEYDENVTVKTYHSTFSGSGMYSSYPNGIYNGYQSKTGNKNTKPRSAAYDDPWSDWVDDDDVFDWERGTYAPAKPLEPLVAVAEKLDENDMAELYHYIHHYVTVYPTFTADCIMREIEDEYPGLDLIPVIKAAILKREEEV